MASTLSLSFLAGSDFFSAGGVWLLPLSVSSAAAGHADQLKILNRTVSRTPGSKRLVLIDSPPFDEHLAQLAARVEWVAGEDQQVGRFARLKRTLSFVETKQGGGPRRQGFQGHFSRQAAFYQISNGEKRKILRR